MHNLQDIVNNIDTLFVKDLMFHTDSAKYAIHCQLRGFGRFHQNMAKLALENMLDSNKYIIDNLQLMPESYNVPSKNYNFNYQSLSHHIKHWHKMLDSEVTSMKHLYKSLAEHGEMGLAKKVLCFMTQKEDEKLRIRIVDEILTRDNYSHETVRIVSEKIHKYFEYEYKLGNDIDFDI